MHPGADRQPAWDASGALAPHSMLCPIRTHLLCGNPRCGCWHDPNLPPARYPDLLPAACPPLRPAQVQAPQTAHPRPREAAIPMTAHPRPWRAATPVVPMTAHPRPGETAMPLPARLPPRHVLIALSWPGRSAAPPALPTAAPPCPPWARTASLQWLPACPSTATLPLSAKCECWLAQRCTPDWLKNPFSQSSHLACHSVHVQHVQRMWSVHVERACQ